MRRYEPTWAMLLGLVLVSAVGAAIAETQSPPREELSAPKLIEAARAALAKDALDDAELLLEGVRPGEGDIDDLDFLHGAIALKRGDWQTAIARFRAMLARNPNLPRVRLDLALAHFRAGEDRRAAHHFRLALGAEDLPPVVRVRALALLDEIRRQKSWSITGSVSLAPDSNINAATSATEVELFGVPAQLSEDARRTSGVGLSANLSGGYEGRISHDVRWRAAADLRTRTYRDGPVQRAGGQPAGRAPLSVREIRRASGIDGAGAEPRRRRLQPRDRARAFRNLADRTGMAVERRGPGRTNFLRDLPRRRSQLFRRLGLAHALGKATLLRADSAFRREKLDQDAYSWKEYIVGVSATRELPRGFVVSAGPIFRWREYGAPLPTFGPEARQDRTSAARITVSNRRIDLYGFSPQVTLRHERRHSNLDLHDYERTVAEFSMVRSF